MWADYCKVGSRVSTHTQTRAMYKLQRKVSKKFSIELVMWSEHGSLQFYKAQISIELVTWSEHGSLQFYKAKISKNP